jgi:hypothetical protein
MDRTVSELFFGSRLPRRQALGYGVTGFIVGVGLLLGNAVGSVPLGGLLAGVWFMLGGVLLLAGGSSAYIGSEILIEHRQRVAGSGLVLLGIGLAELGYSFGNGGLRAAVLLILAILWVGKGFWVMVGGDTSRRDGAPSNDSRNEG